MRKCTITDLRQHLFDTIAGLKDKEHPMDIARAEAVVKVADAVIASAKVEVEFMRATGQKEIGNGFLQIDNKPAPVEDESEDEDEGDEPLPAGITGRTVHRLKG